MMEKFEERQERMFERFTQLLDKRDAEKNKKLEDLEKDLEQVKANPFKDMERTFTPNGYLIKLKIKPSPSPSDKKKFLEECRKLYSEKYGRAPKRNSSGSDLLGKDIDEEICERAWKTVNEKRGMISRFFHRKTPYLTKTVTTTTTTILKK